MNLGLTEADNDHASRAQIASGHVRATAFVMSKYLDILAWNGLAGALLADLDQMTHASATTSGWYSPILG